MINWTKFMWSWLHTEGEGGLFCSISCQRFKLSTQISKQLSVSQVIEAVHVKHWLSCWLYRWISKKLYKLRATCEVKTKKWFKKHKNQIHDDRILFLLLNCSSRRVWGANPPPTPGKVVFPDVQWSFTSLTSNPAAVMYSRGSAPWQHCWMELQVQERSFVWHLPVILHVETFNWGRQWETIWQSGCELLLGL